MIINMLFNEEDISIKKFVSAQRYTVQKLQKAVQFKSWNEQSPFQCFDMVG